MSVLHQHHVTPTHFAPAPEAEHEIHDVLRNLWSKNSLERTPFGTLYQKELQKFSGKSFVYSASRIRVLEKILGAFDLPQGSEIICSSWIDPMYVRSILAMGFHPVFAEINPYTLSLDYSDVSHKLTKWTGAILLHYPCGFPADPYAFASLASEKNLRLIEIVPTPIGSKIDNRLIGTHADVGIFETHPNQSYTQQKDCFILTDSVDVAHVFANQKDSHFSHLDGALGLWFLQNFQQQCDLRRSLADRYHQAFTRLLNVSVLYELANAQWVHYLYPLRVSHKVRERLIDRLAQKEIPYCVPSLPVHLLSYIQNALRHPQLLTTEKLMRETIYLPIHPRMSSEQQKRIIDEVVHFFKNDSFL